MEELATTEDEIEWAVKKLRNHRSGRPSGMRVKHLKGWLAAARNKEKEEAASKQENPTVGRTMPGHDRTGREGTEERRDKTTEEASNWNRVVDIIQTAFVERRPAEEAI